MSISFGSILMDQPPAERFNRIIESLLVTLLAFCPLAFGAVHAWSEQVVISLAAAMAMVFLLKLLICRHTRFVWSWVYVPIALFVLIAAFQLVAMSSESVAAISPETAVLKTELLGSLSNADHALSSMTLSFYPCATRHDLRLVLAIAAVFVIVLNVYRGSERIKRLLAAIAIIGGAIALLALAQDIMGNGKIYWFVPTYDQAYSGTFINHSHYGQFMNLSMGAALALLLVLLHEAFTGCRVTPARVANYVGSPEARSMKLLVAMIVVGAATVFVSLTRGGMLSMLVAAVFVTLVLCSRRSLKGQAWILVLVAMGAFVCVLWVGFEEVYDRLASFRDIGTIEGGRWGIVKDTIAAWTKFPIFGTGLGTYEVVYPMFDSSNIPALATHAENEYVQTLAETGFLGFLTLAVFGIGIWVSFARSVNVPSAPIRSAVYGLGFGLLAILVHSLSDFGQHMPANAMLTATTCALLVGLTHMDRRSQSPPNGVLKGVFVRAVRLVGLVLTAAVFGWALLGANGARIAQAHWDKVLATEEYLEDNDWQGDPETYDYLFTHADAAVAAEPDNIKYRHWRSVYKWLILAAEYADPNTDQLDADALPQARQIANELHQARAYCPTFGATACVAGEIERFVLNDPVGTEHIAQGYRLAPCDATACFAAARADAQMGETGPALEKLGRAIRLDASYFTRAASLCIEDLMRPDLAIELAGEDTGRLSYVANALAATDRHTELVEQTRARISQLVAEKSRDPDAPAWMHVFMAGRDAAEGDVDSAIERYRVALRKEYGRVRWHYDLAMLLARTGKVQDAMSEARICLRFQPDFRPAKKLLEELSVLPNGREPPFVAER